MDDLLRRSAAHVLVGDVAAPALGDDAAHHVRRVLRLRDGEPVTVTDGRGRWRACALAGSDVAPVGDVVVVAAPDPALTLAVSPPKGDRLDWLVVKATEAGVDRIVLIDAERSVVRLQRERLDRQLARLLRISAEAAMQSRRVWLPVIDGPEPATAWLATGAVAEPGGRPVACGDHTVVVGPEGGWSADELSVVDDDRRVGLGDNVLRVETAAIAGVVLLTYHRAGGWR